MLLHFGILSRVSLPSGFLRKVNLFSQFINLGQRHWNLFCFPPPASSRGEKDKSCTSGRFPSVPCTLPGWRLWGPQLPVILCVSICVVGKTPGNSIAHPQNLWILAEYPICRDIFADGEMEELISLKHQSFIRFLQLGPTVDSQVFLNVLKWKYVPSKCSTLFMSVPLLPLATAILATLSSWMSFLSPRWTLELFF